MPMLEDLQKPTHEDNNLWSTFDISVGLDGGFKVLPYEAVVEQLENWYGRLPSQCRCCSSRKISSRDQLMEDLYSLGVRFNPEHKLYQVSTITDALDYTEPLI